LRDQEQRRKQKIRSQQKRYYSKNGRPQEVFNTARKRAAAKQLEFTITLEWLVAKVFRQGDRCEKTGIKFDYGKDARYIKHPFAMSLDRINNDEGYTPENTRLVCSMYNYCRNVARDEDVEFFAWQLFQHKFGARPD
tara:strand:- start:209 stop:619 length:411 start_codon:yes stop_codon:yes gene_type:complete